MKAMSRRTPETHGPSRCRAFTLIELMMAIAIIGILAAIAIPGYEVFIARAKATEIVVKVDELRTRFAEAKASGQLAAKCSYAGVFDPALLVSPYAGLAVGTGGGKPTVLLVVSSRAGKYGKRGVEVAAQSHHILDHAGLVQPGGRVSPASVFYAIALVEEPACKSLSGK